VAIPMSKIEFSYAASWVRPRGRGGMPARAAGSARGPPLHFATSGLAWLPGPRNGCDRTFPSRHAWRSVRIAGGNRGAATARMRQPDVADQHQEQRRGAVEDFVGRQGVGLGVDQAIEQAQ